MSTAVGLVAGIPLARVSGIDRQLASWRLETRLETLSFDERPSGRRLAAGAETRGLFCFLR
jgi:hypothetical protein